MTTDRPPASGRAWWRGRDVALGYAAVVAVVGVALAVAPTAMADRVISSSSTNVVNLRQHPPFALAEASATDVGVSYVLVSRAGRVAAFGPGGS